MTDLQKKYDSMDKTNMSYEEFEKACYERAKHEPDPVYAKDGLDWGKRRNGIERLYNQGESVESAVYLLCF